MAGHLGCDETIRKAMEILPWTGMHQWIADYIKGCTICQQNKILTHWPRIPLYWITTKEGTLPFQQIVMDLITGLLQHHGHNAILTIVDHGCSHAAIFLPCSDTITRPGIAQLYLDYVYQWFGLPTRMISGWDPRFTSQFSKALTKKLGIQRNLSTAFHPQTDRLSERKNQWVEQYLRLVTLSDPKGWTHWLALAMVVHNNWINTTTGLSPNQILFGYNPMLNSNKVLQTHNTLVESQVKAMTKNCTNAIQALNKVTDQKGPPPSQFQIREQVWLDASHLKLPHQKAKLTPKCLGPFRITQEISPVAYHLELPTNWRIHNIFHASLLMPYHETQAHGPNFTWPPPDLIDEEDKYEVKWIVTHRQFGRSKKLQYLIKWKGYPESDNTWEPADQVHAPQLIKHYQSAAHHQSAVRIIHQSATPPTCIKTLQVNLQTPIKCPTILPTSLSNASQKTSPLKSSPHSNVLSTTSTPLNLVLTVSSASATSLVLSMSSTTAGTASSTTAPFTTPTKACPTPPSMPQPNPLITAPPLPESLVLVASSPFQSQPYSASPAPLTRITPSPASPNYSMWETPPTLGVQTYPLSLTSHWDDSHPSWSAMPSPPPTWTHPRSTPLSMHSSKLQTAIISNISTRSGPRMRNIKQQSTSWRKTSSSPSLTFSITKKPLSRLQMGTLLMLGYPHSLSPLEMEWRSLPSGSNSSMMGMSLGIVNTMGLETSLTSKRYMLPPLTAVSTCQKFFPSGFGKPFKGHPCNTRSFSRLFGTLTTGGFTPRSSTTANSMRVSSTTRPNLIPPTPSLPQPSPPDFSPLLSWKQRDFPSRFHIWQPLFGSHPMSPCKGPGRRDMGVHTRVGCDVIDLTNEDSSSDDEEL